MGRTTEPKLESSTYARYAYEISFKRQDQSEKL